MFGLYIIFFDLSHLIYLKILCSLLNSFFLSYGIFTSSMSAAVVNCFIIYLLNLHLRV